MEQDSNILIIKSGKTAKRFSIDEIAYIMCESPICYLHFKDCTTFICTKPLCFFEKALPTTSFVRINHNVIVGTDHIREVKTLGKQTRQVTMKSGDLLNISYRRWRMFRDLYFRK